MKIAWDSDAYPELAKPSGAVSPNKGTSVHKGRHRFRELLHPRVSHDIISYLLYRLLHVLALLLLLSCTKVYWHAVTTACDNDCTSYIVFYQAMPTYFEV